MISPMDSGGDMTDHHAGGSAYGSGDSSGAKSPLHMNLGFLKGLTEKKMTRGLHLSCCTCCQWLTTLQMGSPPNDEVLSRIANRLSHGGKS